MGVQEDSQLEKTWKHVVERPNEDYFSIGTKGPLEPCNVDRYIYNQLWLIMIIVYVVVEPNAKLVERRGTDLLDQPS